MKLYDKVYIIDRNRRSYDAKRSIIKEKMIAEVTVTRETKQSFFITYLNREYRYSKKDNRLVSTSGQELYGIDSQIYNSIENALQSLKPNETVKPVKLHKNSERIVCNNGSIINLEHKFLDESFCEKVSCWAYQNNKFKGIKLNTFFFAEAVKEYIKETGETPVYENN